MARTTRVQPNESLKSDKNPIIGFIGLGNIGVPIAECLLRAGHRLVVYDVRPEPLILFESNAEIAHSPADVANQADLVFACLASSETYRNAVIGPLGIAQGSRVRVYVHLGTTGVELVTELADHLSRLDVATVDAPITGGVARARKGTLIVMASGPAHAIAAATPFMNTYADRIVHFGDSVGAAQVMKLISSMLACANFIAAGEAMLLGAKAGLDPNKMLEVLNNGSGQNSATLIKIPAHVLTRTFEIGGALAVDAKDLREYVAEASRRAVPASVGTEVLRWYVDAIANGSALDDSSTVMQNMERRAGVLLTTT